MGIDGVNDALPAVVAAVTAYINDQTLNQCYSVGMVDVLSKPVNSKTLDKLIKKYHKSTEEQLRVIKS